MLKFCCGNYKKISFKIKLDRRVKVWENEPCIRLILNRQQSLFYFLGFDEMCFDDEEVVCNGPLVPGRRYEIAYRGNNPSGTSNLTEYGGDVFLPDRQREGELVKFGSIQAWCSVFHCCFVFNSVQWSSVFSSNQIRAVIFEKKINTFRKCEGIYLFFEITVPVAKLFI